MTDYLDPDVAYLLGLIVGRGKISEDIKGTTILIHFPFKKPEAEGYDQSAGFIKSIHLTVRKRIENILEVNPDIFADENKGDVTIRIFFSKRPVSLRDINLLLQNKKSYYEFVVPDEIFKTDDIEIIREFIRGYADVAGSIRKANRDQIGRHRVYIDVLNPNWLLPIQLCRLFQDKLKIPVQSIIWGHPNIRDPLVKGGSEAWSREHQIKIYAEDFIKAGFYISHKTAILKRLVKENEMRFPDKISHFCDPTKGKRLRGKAKRHRGEKENSLPDCIRNKHFNAYWQICAALGCEKAKKAVRLINRQQNIF